ncbi:MAG: carboxypeptidase regulatory-like domain-containing protein [Bacteroidetes bacterium]|nr:carboxypeptidase regulatory-like domain-containing protein [Bacteroidota bacterium]
MQKMCQTLLNRFLKVNLFLFLTVLSSMAIAQNLITNSTFSANGSGWSTNGVLSYSNHNVTGTFMMLNTADAPGTTNVWQWVPAYEGSTYTFSGVAATHNVAGTASVRLEFYAANQTTLLGTSAIRTITANYDANNWTAFSTITYTAPTNTAFIKVLGTSVGRALKWDNLMLTTVCNNVTDAGSIGYDETFCGLSFNPSNIVNVTLPSGGSGDLEYVWLISYDGGNTNTVISGANGASYDPGVITQTTWYRRCARRSYCTDYVGESNWIKKELCPVPTANAGPNKNLTCTTTSATIGTTLVAGITYSWSPSIGLNVTNVAQPIASPNATTIYTVTATNACGCTASSTVTVNVNNTPPTTDAGPDKNLNCSVTSITIGTVAIVGNTYSWSPSTGLNNTTIAQPTATPAVTTTYTVTVTGSNGCTATDVVTVNVNTSTPTANAGPDKNLNCSVTSTTIGTVAIVGNTYSWSPSTGLNNTTIAQPTASPAVSTTYTVTVTGANGCTATDVVTVNVNTTTPTADAGPDKNLNCSVTSITIGTVAIVGNTYSWSPSTGLNNTTIAQPTATPAVTTTYTVTVTGSNGCTATDVVTVNVNTSTPTANAGPDKNLNCSVTSATIGTVAIVGNTYSWSPSTGLNNTTIAQPTASPAVSTTYTVTVTGANGCTATDVVTVNVNTTTPTADAGPDKNLNCSVTSTTIGTVAIVGNTYSWSPSTGLNNTTIAQPTASPAVSTTYTVTVTGANGCTATDVVTVNVNTSTPTANAGPDKNLNCSVTSTTIGTVAIVGNTYSWLPSTGLNNTTIAQPTANPAVTTTYTVTVTGANGCTATDVVTVNVNTTTPTADAGPDKNLNCSVTSTTIGTVAIVGNTYSWLPSTGLNNTTIAQPTANPAVTTTYTVTVTGANGCTATDVVTVNVNTTTPTADAGPDKNLDCSVTSTTIGTVAIVGNTYSWLPSTGLNNTTIAQPTASPAVTTTYTVTVTGANGCTATDVVTVNVNTTTPTADAGPDKNLDCSVTSTTIGTVAIVGNTYSWLPSTGLNNTTIAEPTASPAVTTTYTVTVTGANGCIATDVVTVNVNNTTPIADAGPDKNLDCSVTSTTIGTVAIVGNTYSWLPSTGLNNTTIAEPTASPAVTTTYTVTVTGDNGCTATDVVTVNVNTTTPTADAGPDKNLDCSVTSTTIGTVAIVGNTYSWLPSTGLNNTTIAEPTANPAVTTIYTVTVTGANGCTATDVVTVNVNTTTPTADAGPDKNLDCSVTSTTIGTVAIVGNTYSWLPSTGLNNTTIAEPTASPAVTTTYTVTVTGANGCTATDVVTVNVNTTTPTADAGPDKNLDCSVTSTTIGTVAIVGNTYSWLPSTGLNNTTIAEPTANPAVTTTYTVTVTGANGCTATDVVTVNVNTTPPTADAGPDKLIDCHVTSVIIGTASIVGNTYSWTPSLGLNDSTLAEPTANPLVNTIYTLTVTGVNGCTATDMVQVSINQVPPTVIISGNLEVCNGSQTTLTVTGAGTYVWSTGATSSSITVGEGTYSVTATDGVCTNSTTATVIKVQGSIGNYVWNDLNLDGIQNEIASAGINDVTVQLWDAGLDMSANTQDDILLQTVLSSNDANNNPGYYHFDVCNSGNYFVKFPTTVNGKVTTSSNPTAGIDFNSDINSMGSSPVFNIDVYGTGVAKDNNTIDAGYIDLKYIGNYVWFDLNRDGIQDPNEAGVSGITVTLLNDLNSPVASTVTDAYGYYLFNNILSGTYKIAFTLPPGFVFSPQDMGANNETDSDVDPVTGITSQFVYVSGTIDLSFDAGIYLPTPLKSELGDRVWNDFNHNGIQDFNEVGIAGVTVTLYQNNTPVAYTISDADGHYYFQNLDPGTYSIGFSLPIGYVFSGNGLGGNTATDSDPDPISGRTSTVTIVAGEINHTIDAGMYPQPPSLVLPASIGNFVWNDINNNGVQDENESGIQGITVDLYDSTGLVIIATTTTDIFGYYIFNNLTPGQYQVGFSNIPNGFSFVAQHVGDPALDSDPAFATGRTAFVTLSAGELNTTIDAGLHNAGLPTAALGNFIWFDRNIDGIQDLNENGAAGVTVRLYDNTNTLLATTISNNNGYYIFNNLAAGTYYVNFSNFPPGYKLTMQTQGANTAVDSDPEITTGSTSLITLNNGEINLTVDAGLAPNDNRITKGSIGDKVWNDVDADGIQDEGELGVQGVTVTLYQQNGITVISSTQTDPLGNYIFTDLDQGSYVVGFSNLPIGYTFSSANQGNDTEIDADADAASGGKTTIILLDEGDIILSIDAGIHQAAGLAGIGDIVWNDLNLNGLQDQGEPGIPGVTVKLINNLGVILANTTTDANGVYQFTGLTPGDYKVQFSNLPAGYSFTTPNAGVNSQEALDSDADIITGETDIVSLNAGDYNQNLDAGIFTLKSSLGNYVWEDVDIDGIQDANEKGLSGIVVTLYNQVDQVVAYAITNSAGGYNFVNLEPGDYSVQFSNIPQAGVFSPKHQLADSTIDSDVNPITGFTDAVSLVAGQYNPTIDAGIHLPTGTGLGNFVWLDNESWNTIADSVMYSGNGIQDANEIGVAGVTVTLYDEFNTPIKSTITTQNGAYSFNDLIPGKYSVGFSTIPVFYQPNGKPYGSTFTFHHAGTDSTLDSDADLMTGRTGQYDLQLVEYNPTVDAGITLLIPLPALELTAFATLNNNNSVKVSWKTVTEMNTSKFEIQRSLDGKVFETVATTNASGNTHGETNYSIDDDISNISKKAIIYYRVKLVDIDNQFSLSNVVHVKLVEAEIDATVYPSPFTQYVNVLYTSELDGQVNIKMMDMNGKVIADKLVDLTPGKNILTIDNLQTLSTGMYSIQITDLETNTKTYFKVTKE